METVKKRIPRDLNGKDLKEGDKVKFIDEIVDYDLGLNDEITIEDTVYYDKEENIFRLSDSDRPINIYDKFTII